jgi:hypothetical protein
MEWLVVSRNNLFFAFLVVGYLFGVILYDFLPLGYIDELMALFLGVFAVAMVAERRRPKQLLPLAVTVGVMVIYAVYSFAIKSNVAVAIVKDFVIQIKPFLGLFCTLIIAPQLNARQKRFLALLSIAVACFIAIVWLNDSVWDFFGHPSRFATAAAATALLFFYCTSFSAADIALFAVLLLIGVLSTRSKYYGFCMMALLMTFYMKCGGRIHLDAKSVAVLLLSTSAAIVIAWHKITVYYIDGSMNSREMWSRPAMMLASWKILLDYFPLGSGLASFGTFASAEYYSTIYHEYGLDHLWGLSKERPDFITDAFYPELAQFGVVGVLLYIVFWWRIVRRGLQMQSRCVKSALLVLMVFLFFLIEGVADSTFTHNRGLFILIIMGCALTDGQAAECNDGAEEVGR